MKYHTYNLALGTGDRGDEWEFERIGTEREKMHVERELQELRDRLLQVSAWKARRDEVEKELARVWVADDHTDESRELEAPPYVDVKPDAGAETEAEGEVRPAEVDQVDSQ
ncbi:hypothetical protein DL770_009989 [Monosporascus sp. CRB-9-2]|nr:hypothetical protein DL770_009989 [Monosporascus sp. CRB-9-2]